MFKQFNEYIEADREIIIAVDKNVNDTDILIIEGIENVINTTSHMVSRWMNQYNYSLNF